MSYQTGAVYMFRYYSASMSPWSQIFKLQPSDGVLVGDVYNTYHSVSLNDHVVIVGSKGDSDPGADTGNTVS